MALTQHEKWTCDASGQTSSGLGRYAVQQATHLTVAQRRWGTDQESVGDWDARAAAWKAWDQQLQARSRRRRRQTGEVKHISSRIGGGLATARTYEIRQHRKCVSRSLCPAGAKQRRSNPVSPKLSNPASRWLTTAGSRSSRERSCGQPAGMRINPQRRARSGRSQRHLGKPVAYEPILRSPTDHYPALYRMNASPGDVTTAKVCVSAACSR